MSTLTGELNIAQNLTGEINKNLEYVTPVLQEKIATPTKQTQNITPDENYDALSKVVVNPIPNEYIIPNYQTKNVTIVQNEVQEITPDENYDGLSKVNVTTSIPAPVLQEKTITPTSQTQNVTPDSNYDGLSKVVVNGVSGYVDWSAIGYSGTPQSVIDGYNYAKQIYDNWDSSQTSYNQKFSNDLNLIIMPNVDTSNGTSFNSTFSGCYGLLNIPLFDTSNGENFASAFASCYELKNIPLLEMGKAISVYLICSSCFSLTTLGGFKDLGKAYLTTASANYRNYKLDLSYSTNLTHDSLMNVINNLYDIATKGCQPQQLVLGSTNLAKLTAEEIAIATNKGWNVS